MIIVHCKALQIAMKRIDRVVGRSICIRRKHFLHNPGQVGNVPNLAMVCYSDEKRNLMIEKTMSRQNEHSLFYLVWRKYHVCRTTQHALYFLWKKCNFRERIRIMCCIFLTIFNIAIRDSLAYRELSITRIFTHWGWDKMAAISQTTLSNAFSWMKL